MRLEKYRHIMILNALCKADAALTAEELSELTKSSLRTIKSDIVELNPLCKEEGFSIRSYKAKGYQIEVHDEKEYKRDCFRIAQKTKRNSTQKKASEPYWIGGQIVK